MSQPCVEETWHSVEEGDSRWSPGKAYGKLTSKAIEQLQKYYGRVIRSHPNDLEGKRYAVFDSFLHALSTDEDPHHDRCPARASIGVSSL